jgi:hypothetical protein
MPDIYPPPRQKAALTELAQALNCRPAALRRDECGDWRIVGRFGHIYAIPGAIQRHNVEGFQIYFRGADEFREPPSGSSGWHHAKQAMAFAQVTNDGDGEGVLFLDRLPTAAEGDLIRDKLRIPKKREMSEAALEHLASVGQATQFVRRPGVGDEAASTGRPFDGAPVAE